MKTINNTLISADNNYFDLLAYNEDVKMVHVAAEVASSTAWRIDTMLVNGGRQLLKFIKTENFNQGGYASMSEVLTALGDAEFAEQCFHEIGTHMEGTLESIRALNAQRDQWHDEAQRLVSMTTDNTLRNGVITGYVIPDIEAEFTKKQTFKVDNQTQRRLKTSSDRMAEMFGAPELAEVTFQRRLVREQDNLNGAAMAIKEQGSLALFMFNMALRTDSGSAASRSKNFYDLPLEAQRVLLDNAGNAAMRAAERAAKNRSLSETEFDMIDLTALKVMSDLKKVAGGNRFRAAAIEPANV